MAEQLTDGLMAHPMAMDLEDQIRDMRAIQHFMLQHPQLPVSYVSGRTCQISVPHPEVDGVTDWDTVDVAAVAAIVRIMKDGGPVEKRTSDLYMTYTRRVGRKARIELSVERKAVCTAKVVATETVQHAAVPAYTETIEKIEWDCQPLLAAAEEDVA